MKAISEFGVEFRQKKMRSMRDIQAGASFLISTCNLRVRAQQVTKPAKPVLAEHNCLNPTNLGFIHLAGAPDAVFGLPIWSSEKLWKMYVILLSLIGASIAHGKIQGKVVEYENL